jgi:hypothetical protein
MMTRKASTCLHINRRVMETASARWHLFLRAQRLAFGRMRRGRRIQALGDRSFLGTKKTTFMIANVRPEGHPHASVRKPHRRLPDGAFDSVGRGREGPLPIELYLLHPAFCLCYQKPPACTLMPLPHAIESLGARASVARSLSLYSLQPPRESFHRFPFRHSKKRYRLGVTSLAFTRPDRKALPAHSPPCF